MKGISRKWLIGIAVLLVALFAVGVPVLAAAGNDNPAPPAFSNGNGPGCVDSGTLAKVATALGVTPADLATQLQSGKTLAAIAGEKNVATTAVVEAIIAPFEARVNLQVQNGYLTQTQAQTYLDAARQAAGNMLTLNLASVTGYNNWAGFCGNYLDGNGNPVNGFGPMGPVLGGALGGCMRNPVPPATPGLTPPATPPVYGSGMMGGGWGCR